MKVAGYMWSALFSDGTEMRPYPHIFKSELAAIASREQVTKFKSEGGALRVDCRAPEERWYESESEIDRINSRMQRAM
jgi:hypothetical protein